MKATKVAKEMPQLEEEETKEADEPEEQSQKHLWFESTTLEQEPMHEEYMEALMSQDDLAKEEAIDVKGTVIIPSQELTTVSNPQFVMAMSGPGSSKFLVLGGKSRGTPYEQRYLGFQIVTKPTSGLANRWESV